MSATTPTLMKIFFGKILSTSTMCLVGCLRKVKNTTTQALVAEYKYNGLGFRISVHEDTDTDGDVDASDQWYHYVYDTRWRIIATFRAGNNEPRKEQFLYHHQARSGGDGLGGSAWLYSPRHPARSGTRPVDKA